MIYQGCPDPLSPLWIRPWHASERRQCLKCSFQRVVIIGRKVGLDYNSWYACLPLIRHAGRSSGSKLQTLIAERERERERDCTVFAHESIVLAWFLRISKRNVWVSQSILLQLLPMRTQNPNLSCASAFVRHSRTFHSINALRTFHRMHTFLNCLNTIRV